MVSKTYNPEDVLRIDISEKGYVKSVDGLCHIIRGAAIMLDRDAECNDLKMCTYPIIGEEEKISERLDLTVNIDTRRVGEEVCLEEIIHQFLDIDPRCLHSLREKLLSIERCGLYINTRKFKTPDEELSDTIVLAFHSYYSFTSVSSHGDCFAIGSIDYYIKNGTLYRCPVYYAEDVPEEQRRVVDLIVNDICDYAWFFNRPKLRVLVVQLDTSVRGSSRIVPLPESCPEPILALEDEINRRLAERLDLRRFIPHDRPSGPLPVSVPSLKNVVTETPNMKMEFVEGSPTVRTHWNYDVLKGVLTVRDRVPIEGGQVNVFTSFPVIGEDWYANGNCPLENGYEDLVIGHSGDIVDIWATKPALDYNAQNFVCELSSILTDLERTGIAVTAQRQDGSGEFYDDEIVMRIVRDGSNQFHTEAIPGNYYFPHRTFCVGKDGELYMNKGSRECDYLYNLIFRMSDDLYDLMWFFHRPDLHLRFIASDEEGREYDNIPGSWPPAIQTLANDILRKATKIMESYPNDYNKDKLSVERHE